MAKRNLSRPTLPEKLDALQRALAAGVTVKLAFEQSGLTPRQYGLAMFHTKPQPAALFETRTTRIVD